MVNHNTDVSIVEDMLKYVNYKFILIKCYDLSYCIVILGRICSAFDQSRYLLDKHNLGLMVKGDKMASGYYMSNDTLEEVQVLSTLVLQQYTLVLQWKTIVTCLF